MTALPTVLLSPVEADLVLAATENCPTCEGSGVSGSTARADGYGGLIHRTIKCPDCSGKRPGVVTLVVEGEIWECDHGTRIAHHWSPPSRWAFDGQRVTLTAECPTCDGLGHFCDPGHGTPVAGCPDCTNGTVPLVTALVTVTPAGDGTHWNVTLDTNQEGS